MAKLISEPIIIPISNGYRFIWSQGKEEVLSINVDRVKSVGDAIWAEISAEHEFEVHPKLRRIRINLLTQRGRSDIAKRILELNLPIQLNWNDLIEQVCNEVIDRVRQGEPVIEISSNDEVKPLEYLIDPIAPLNKPTVLFGDPGSGKSQLAVILNIVITLPWIKNPLRLITPSKPVVALFLDYEADPDDLRRQLASLVRGMDLGYVKFNYRRCSFPLADDLDAIRNHIEDVQATCLFIDSMSLAAGGDLNRMDVATAYFRSLRQLKDVTSISLAHTSKDRENKTKTIIGSVLFEAGSRSVWEVRGQEDEDTFDIGLFHRKSNLSKSSPPLAFRITYENNLPVNVAWYDPKSIPEFVERMSINRQVLETLKRGELSSEELVIQLEAKRSAVDNSVSRLSRKGLIIGNSKGWALPARLTDEDLS